MAVCWVLVDISILPLLGRTLNGENRKGKPRATRTEAHFPWERRKEESSSCRKIAAGSLNNPLPPKCGTAFGVGHPRQDAGSCRSPSPLPAREGGRGEALLLHDLDLRV